MKLFSKKTEFQPFVYILAVVVPLGIGFLGSLANEGSLNVWYELLVRPILAPPNWVFGPVWTILYLLMGTASYLVWQQRKKPYARKALVLYGLQLGLNLVWSFAFFGLQSLLVGFIDIVLLLVVIGATIVMFDRVDKRAGWLLLPYIVWVGFATYLNLAFLLLN
ncbi:MAG: TspO/MBR family protein [Patescibacteria group bacterium]